MPVPAGEALSPGDERRLERAAGIAEELSHLTFSVYVGTSAPRPRSSAEQIHAQLEQPDDSVLVLCDPDARALEIVTGPRARRVLDDFDCRLAAASMRTSFQAGDLLGGLVNGVQQLGQAARRPAALHTGRLN